MVMMMMLLSVNNDDDGTDDNDNDDNDDDASVWRFPIFTFQWDAVNLTPEIVPVIFRLGGVIKDILN